MINSVLINDTNSNYSCGVLKTRLKQERVENTTICSTLKLSSQDDKMCFTNDV